MYDETPTKLDWLLLTSPSFPFPVTDYCYVAVSGPDGVCSFVPRSARVQRPERVALHPATILDSAGSCKGLTNVYLQFQAS